MISLASLCRALSTERLGAYSHNDDRDSLDAIARYLWNGALCVDTHPALHALEVTLRNALFRASEDIVSVTGRTLGSTGCWLDCTPSLLLEKEANEVADAKRRLGANPKRHTPGRLIAKLGFGFWTGLCKAPYEHGRVGGPRLWPAIIRPAFPNVPKPQRTRQAIADKLDSIRKFRNRVAHHEAIWDRDLLARYDEILEVLGWMNPAMRNAARACSEVELTFHSGPGKYRPLAAKLMGTTS